MKRRDLLKSCLIAPLAELSSAVKAKITPNIEPETGAEKGEAAGQRSDCPSSPSTSITASVESSTKFKDTPIDFYKEVQFGEPFCGRIVDMITYEDCLWIATDKNMIYVIKSNET